MLSRPTRRSARSSARATATRLRRKARGLRNGRMPSRTSISPTALRNGTSMLSNLGCGARPSGHKKRAPCSGPPVVRLYRVMGPPAALVLGHQSARLQALAAAQPMVFAPRQLHFQGITAVLAGLLAAHGAEIEQRSAGAT